MSFAPSAPRSEFGALYDRCRRPPLGSAVLEPKDLRSRDGVLRVDLTIYDEKEPDGSTRDCYLTPDGAPSPTLRLHPGDLLVLRLRNALTGVEPDPTGLEPGQGPVLPICRGPPRPVADIPADACTSGAMAPMSTNLHFHGLTVPSLCHQDDVMRVSIPPGDTPFEYRFRIPADEPPGLYWYHPHIHGHSKVQVLGGASGALIIEGLERAVPDVAGLPERVLVIRDQDLLNPTAPPSKSEPVMPKMLIDRDGDTANNGTGFGRPAKDLSINFVPVPYPEYPPAAITMKPGERQLWRVINASAITYLNLAVLFRHAPQRLGVVAIDGVPLRFGGSPAQPVVWVDHIALPPAARAEFILTGPPSGVPALLVSRTVDTGPGGENDPNRALASIIAAADSPEPESRLPSDPVPLPQGDVAWLGDVAPTRVRKLYFSEKLDNPDDPTSASVFYITEEGHEPVPFDPSASAPNIVVRQGEIEDWIIENRSMELHAFHIHQLHFQLRDWSGLPVDEPFLRDTVNVPYYNGRALTYPSVKVRLDFRDPNTVGTFVYHCHLLDHEDGGMMGTIRVDPAQNAKAAKVSPAAN